MDQALILATGPDPHDSQQQPDAQGIRLNFRDIETLLGGALPAAAKKHQSWWASNPNEAQSQAWLEAG